MYSMVLMAALTTGTDVPDWGRRGWGCCGCYGGYGWGGGWGRGYGGYGWGGWGGGYGGYGWGGWGGYGGYGLGYGAWGGYGGWGYAAAPGYYYSYAAPVAVASTPIATSTRSMYYDPAPDTNRATIIVHLPAAARLIVDGKPTQSTSSVRRFVSPPLSTGENHYYIFKAEMDRNGQTVTTRKRVDVMPGQTENVHLQFADLDESSERAAPPRQPAEGGGLPNKNTPIDRP